MKGAKFLLGITLSLGTLGAAVGGAVFANNTNKSAEPAYAVTNKTFYLDCSSFEDWDSVSICIGTWNGVVNTYTEATMVVDNYWKVTIDITGLSGVEFYRCPVGNPTGHYDNKSTWNTDCTNNYCKVTGWNQSSSWETQSENGVSETYSVASTTPSTSTKRIWVDPKDSFYNGNARAALRVFSSESYYRTYILNGSSQNLSVGSEAYIFYVDIPATYDCQLVRLHPAFNYIWTYGKNFSEMDQFDTTKIVYQWSENIGGDNPDYSCSNEGSPTVDYAKKVLDGYSTCQNSSVNGYGAYTNISTNIISKLSDDDKSTLRNSTFSDPTYGTRTYGDKLDLMASKSGASSNIVNVLATADNTMIIIILGIFSVLVLTGVGYFYFRKRKVTE